MFDEETKKRFSIKEEKLKPLIPSLRTKKRIVRVKVESDRKFNFKDLTQDLTEQLINYLGIINFGKAGIWFIKERFDYDNQELLIKVSTKHKENLIGVLSLITSIKNSPVNVKIINVSGTIKGALKEK